MLKIPAAYQKAVKVKVTETIECTCQRCGPEPKVWAPKELKFNSDGSIRIPNLCPRCHSSNWWEPVARPGTAAGQRKRHTKNRLKKSLEEKLRRDAIDVLGGDQAVMNRIIEATET